MVPRGEIISIDIKQNYDQIFDIIKDESHSRLPVYEKNLDNIIGFFHIKISLMLIKMNLIFPQYFERFCTSRQNHQFWNF